MSTLRRRTGQRISGAVWGLLVIGVGVLMIASFSGYEVDLELAGILLLAGVGGWLLLSAALAGIGRSRQVAAVTSPTVEEPADDTAVHGDADAEAEAVTPVTEEVTVAEDSTINESGSDARS